MGRRVLLVCGCLVPEWDGVADFVPRLAEALADRGAVHAPGVGGADSLALPAEEAIAFDAELRAPPAAAGVP